MIRACCPPVVVALVGVGLALAGPAAAQQVQTGDMEVARAVVATGVEDREPVGEGEAFPADVGRVFFYTEFEGDFGETALEHVWLRGDEEVARVPVRAAGPRWRTWTSKAIPPDGTGSWTAKVVDRDGNELASVEFTVGGA
jgi:hypothetical protein